MTDQITATTLEVRTDNWAETRVVTESVDARLADSEVLLRVDRFALTSNNISYAATGDSLGYWGFFPADEGWGRIPAMGWGEVVASAHTDVRVGERVWGWFPFSTHLKIQAGRVNAARISDVRPHRAQYAPVYAQFDRASGNPIYEEAREDQDSLLRGLFTTSWLVEDFLDVNDAFGADACLITSASSKTSIALGHCVAQRGDLDAVGITSAGNVAFCENLGCYDTIVTYDDIASLETSLAVVSVDMAGSAKVLGDLHHHFGDNMKQSCLIGATHHEERGDISDLPGAKPEFFFAPTHVTARNAELGTDVFMMQLGSAYVGFRKFADGWLNIERHYGPDAVADVYQMVLAGNADPAIGHILSMRPRAA